MRTGRLDGDSVSLRFCIVVLCASAAREHLQVLQFPLFPSTGWRIRDCVQLAFPCAAQIERMLLTAFRAALAECAEQVEEDGADSGQEYAEDLARVIELLQG